MRTLKYVTVVLVAVLILAVALAGGGCKKAAPPPGDDTGSTSGDTGGPGSTGGSGGGIEFTGQPGQGLPVDLPSGLLLFARGGHSDGSTGNPFDVMTTMDPSGQNLTERFALSPDERRGWKLSPDGTKLAAYRETYDNATGESTGSFHVYDLAAGTVTPIALPSQVWALAAGASQGDFFFWSEDSESVLYSFMASPDRGDSLNPPNLMVSLAHAPADGSEAVFTDIGYGECAFAPIPGRDAIVFGGPYRVSLSSDSDIMNDACLEIYDFQTRSARTVCNTANSVSTLAVSFDGRYAAYECEDDYADGADMEYGHSDLSIVDLESGASVFIDDHTDKPTSIFARTYYWSPAADVLAVVLENKNPDDTTYKGVYFWDVAQGRKTAETGSISKYDLLGEAWLPDGTAIFLTLGNDVYRVDAATGQFTSICTMDLTPRGLAVTP